MPIIFLIIFHFCDFRLFVRTFDYLMDKITEFLHGEVINFRIIVEKM